MAQPGVCCASGSDLSARLGVAYWAIVFAVGFVFGIIRTLLVAPHIGATAAVLLEVPLIVIVSATVAARLLRGRVLSWRGRATMGMLALALTLASEAALANVLNHQSFARWAASLVAVPGIIGLAGQLVFATMPLMIVRR